MTFPFSSRERFLEEYRLVRHTEGRGSIAPAYYHELPYRDITGKSTSMWAMRAKTYRFFENRILKRHERLKKRPLYILDLGAGNCWMSYRLRLRGHHVTALDIFSDLLDGLRAARSYPVPIAAVEADFDELPFADEQFDLAIFNASLHYSSDYVHTLREVKRCVRSGGQIVILDSPIYRVAQHGRLMVEERKLVYQQRFGFASDALGSVEFLDEETLELLAQGLHTSWKRYRPWYGWRWHARPLLALAKRKRPPSRFWILSGTVGRQ